MAKGVHGVHGSLNSENPFVTLFVFDILPNQPLELVGEKVFELVHIRASETNIIEKVKMKVLFEIGPVLEMLSVMAPPISDVTRVPSRKVSIYNVTHSVDGFAPARSVHEMLRGCVCEDSL